MIILIKLFLAHLLGDFIFQPYSWVVEKEKKKLKSLKLYIHISIHIVLMFLLLWDLSLTPLIISVGVLHLIIDALKVSFQNKDNKRLIFFIDQLLHILVIFIVYYTFSNSTFSINSYFNEKNLLLITSILFLTFPVALVMRVIFSKWNIEKLTKDNKSLEDAGKYIGILERLLVFVFIINNHWEAVGFLITAKSVFRFGDLRKSKHRQLTEYILIGTLISFGIAILTGLLYLYLSSSL